MWPKVERGVDQSGELSWEVRRKGTGKGCVWRHPVVGPEPLHQTWGPPRSESWTPHVFLLLLYEYVLRVCYVRVT